MDYFRQAGPGGYGKTIEFAQRREQREQRIQKERKQSIPHRNYPMNGLRVCVDEYNNDLSGRIYSKMSKEKLPFRNMSEMLLKADGLFDLRGYPQNFMEKRSFAENTIWDGRFEVPRSFRDDRDVVNQKGKLCTFDIVVNSRRRASWQGILMKQGQFAANFQSAKELLELIMKDLEGSA